MLLNIVEGMEVTVQYLLSSECTLDIYITGADPGIVKGEGEL